MKPTIVKILTEVEAFFLSSNDQRNNNIDM